MVELSTLFTLSLVVGTLIVVRSLYRVLVPAGAAGDAYGQMLQIQDIKDSGHRRPDEPSPVVTSGHYAYPYFVLWLLSYLPRSLLVRTERYFSAIMDLVFVVVIAALVPLELLSVSQLSFVILLLVATPQFMRPDLAHGQGLSSRKPGQVLTTASIFAFVLWVDTGWLGWLATSVVLGGLMCLSSKFSLQAYLFVIVGFSIVLSPIALFLVPGSILVAAVLSGGRYLRILRGHAEHVYDYAVRKQYKMFDHSFPDPIGWFRRIVGVRSGDDVLELFNDSRFLRPFIDNPFVIAVVAALVATTLSDPSITTLDGVRAWIVACLFAFVLTSLPHLLFFGQAERYLEYIFLPSALLIVEGLSTFGAWYTWLIGVVIVSGLAVEAVYVWAYKNIFHSPDRQEKLDGVIKFLKSRDAGVVVAHPTYISREVAWRTPHKVVEFIGGNATTTERSVEELNRLFPDQFSFVTNDVDWLATAFDPDWVVFDLEKLAEMDRPTDDLEQPSADPSFSNDRFAVYPFEVLVSAAGTTATNE
ncbi:hypothetical protein [Halobellus sp. EA9]|uniref:hypothetical protein n=1 Tax=Halobellus sp. EA9 TaxID=3421647 RepID=UPI003EBBC88A